MARETDLKKTSSTDVICIQKPLPPPFNRHWQNTHFLLWSSHRSLTIWFPNLNHDPYSKTPPSQNLSFQFPPFKQRSTTPLTPSSCHYRFLNPLFEILHTPPLSIIDALPISCQWRPPVINATNRYLPSLIFDSPPSTTLLTRKNQN